MNSPEWHTDKTSTGRDPRRCDNNVSDSGRRNISRLNLYHADDDDGIFAVVVVVMVVVPSDSIDSVTMAPSISTPPEERRLKSFLRLRDLPFDGKRCRPSPTGTELRLC